MQLRGLYASKTRWIHPEPVRQRERERESEILEYYGVIIYSSYLVTYDSETPFSTKNTHRAPHVTRLSFTSDTK